MIRKVNRPFGVALGISALAMIVGVSSTALSQAVKASADTLQFVVIVSRHGVRSPTGSVDQLNEYAAQPWPKWDVQPGYLTPRGARLMSLFGAYYKDYLTRQGLLPSPGCEDAAKVDFYADADQRTIETGKALAAGMFPGCAVSALPEQHAPAQGEALFHSRIFSASSKDKLDHARAAASIAGRIGEDPSALTSAYQQLLDRMQGILLGCPTVTPCRGHSTGRLLAEIPASLDAGKDDHLVDLKGPLNTASTIAEDFLLEYTDGMPAANVGWGRVDLQTLKDLMELHTAASDLTRRTPYLAATQASNLLAHILETMQQAATGSPIPGALGKVGDKAVILVGHDTNLANLAGALQINWLIDGRRDDTPPGGALVFELWQRPTAAGYQVRAYYTAQTLEQMRNLVPLTTGAPPARANVFLPGCSQAGPGFPCAWSTFQQTVLAIIDPAFVK